MRFKIADFRKNSKLRFSEIYYFYKEPNGDLESELKSDNKRFRLKFLYAVLDNLISQIPSDCVGIKFPNFGPKIESNLNFEP